MTMSGKFDLLPLERIVWGCREQPTQSLPHRSYRIAQYCVSQKEVKWGHREAGDRDKPIVRHPSLVSAKTHQIDGAHQSRCSGRQHSTFNSSIDGMKVWRRDLPCFLLVVVVTTPYDSRKVDVRIMKRWLKVEARISDCSSNCCLPIIYNPLLCTFMRVSLLSSSGGSPNYAVA